MDDHPFHHTKPPPYTKMDVIIKTFVLIILTFKYVCPQTTGTTFAFSSVIIPLTVRGGGAGSTADSTFGYIRKPMYRESLYRYKIQEGPTNPTNGQGGVETHTFSRVDSFGNHRCKIRISYSSLKIIFVEQ